MFCPDLLSYFVFMLAGLMHGLIFETATKIMITTAVIDGYIKFDGQNQILWLFFNQLIKDHATQ